MHWMGIAPRSLPSVTSVCSVVVSNCRAWAVKIKEAPPHGDALWKNGGVARRWGLLNRNHRVERALVVRDGLGVLGVGAPRAVNHVLVLILAGGKLQRCRVDSLFRLVGHLLRRGIPVIELARDKDALAFLGVDGECDRLLGVGDLRLLLGGFLHRLPRHDLLGRALSGFLDLHFFCFLSALRPFYRLMRANGPIVSHIFYDCQYPERLFFAIIMSCERNLER